MKNAKNLLTGLLLCVHLVAADSVICCGAERVFIIDETGKEQWSWQASDSPQIPKQAHALFRSTDECKPVEDLLVITSSSGGVALIDRESKHCAFYTQAKNAHSACLLPGMRVAVAASTGGDHLYVFNRRKSGLQVKPLKSIPLKGAHGVLWDAQSEICLALGEDELLLLDRTLEVIKRFKLPDHGGHDLSRTGQKDEWFVTTNRSVFRFQMRTGSFQEDPALKQQPKVKSVDVHPKTGALVWHKGTPEHWWSDTIRFQKDATLKLQGERLYKIRWDAPRPSPETETAQALEQLGVKLFKEDGHVKEAVANQLKLTDEDLHLLGWLPFLTDISLEQTQITDEGIAYLADLSRLEWLNLWQTDVGDEGLKIIGNFKRLQHLPIGGTRITDAGLEHIGGLDELVYLGLRETKITDAGTPHIAGLTQLESLNLVDTAITDASISTLSKLNRLKTLRLEGSKISEDGARKLREALPDCLIVR